MKKLSLFVTAVAFTLPLYVVARTPKWNKVSAIEASLVRGADCPGVNTKDYTACNKPCADDGNGSYTAPQTLGKGQSGSKFHKCDCAITEVGATFAEGTCGST